MAEHSLSLLGARVRKRDIRRGLLVAIGLPTMVIQLSIFAHLFQTFSNSKDHYEPFFDQLILDVWTTKSIFLHDNIDAVEMRPINIVYDVVNMK